MYQAFYGLREIPFSIAPNPKYLFLSERHQEALTHLQYCLNGGGGFVLLTGEVGTGKTTLARTLLNNMSDNTDIASILNPSLTEVELLATLCDELAVEYPPQPSLKKLVDVISRFLLNNHQQGRNTLLVIDEAQHLRSEVLEQLRLLTNLETDHKKLLQVILIGQPELQQQLKQQHLRQLAQRITARYHLMPLTQSDVSAYIAHRLKVAGRDNVLFSKKACNRIYQLSEGIPRVINLICEKALLLAYGEQLTEIGVSSINSASSQVLFVDYEEPANETSWLKPALASAVSLIVCFGLTWGILAISQPSTAADNTPANNVTPVATISSVKAKQDLNAETIKPVDISFEQQLQPYLEKSRLRQPAFSGLMGLWGTAEGAGDKPCQSSLQYGLRCFNGNGWSELIDYNHPAVISLNINSNNYYGILVAFDGKEELVIQFHDQRLKVERSWMLQHWNGDFTLLWQPPVGFKSHLRIWNVGEGVSELSGLLNQYYQLAIPAVNSFSQELELQVKRFQADNRLSVDGIAGEKTILKLQVATGQQGLVLLQGNS